MMNLKTLRPAALLCAAAFLWGALLSCTRHDPPVKNEYEQITLPVLEIEVKNGEEVTDRTEYLEMSLSVSGCEKESLNLTSVPGKIRGRGNSSWDFCDKKSYRLKLDLDVNLLGMGKGGDRDWALISNAREKSMMRNYAMFALARKMEMRAVTSCAFVTLMLNGEYLGVYLLTETVEFDRNRLDIDDGGTAVDTGYLIELDNRAKSEAEHRYDYFYVNDWEVPFSIKSSVKNRDQNAFIKAYVEAADRAILSGEREKIEEYMDLRSLVDMYLIEEFSKDRDVGFASLYLYKEAGGKLYFGFPWDFDLALGNDSGEDRALEINSPKIDYKGAEEIMAGVLNRWFEALIEEDWFVKEAADRFFGLSEAFEELFDEVAFVGYSMSEEAGRNYEKWKIMGKKQLFEPMKIVMINTYDGQVAYLLEWMRDRKEWLGEWFTERLEGQTEE